MEHENQKTRLTVTSISYVDDPSAANEWFRLYASAIRQEVMRQASKEDELNHTFEV